MTSFTGFPKGKVPTVAVPEVFFTQLLPEIEDYAELRVTLFFFWYLAQKGSGPRCTTEEELLRNPILMRSLRRQGDPRPPEVQLRLGLEKAIERGTILELRLEHYMTGDGHSEPTCWYFFNTDKSRKVIEQLQGTRVAVAGTMIDKPSHSTQPGNSSASQNNEQAVHENVYAYHPAGGPGTAIYKLYEQHIGILTPGIQAALEAALEQYPVEWIVDAFDEALKRHIRNWNYISAILRRWGMEGRQ